MQRHTIVLWRHPEQKDKCFDSICEVAYNALSVLQRYPVSLRPNYKTVRRKRDAKGFDWSYDNFSKELRKGVNKEGRTIFEDLGFSLSFFSDLVEKDSCAISIHVGNKNTMFNNTMILNLPITLDLSEPANANMVAALFQELVNVFQPFWGCVSTPALVRQYNGYFEKNVPTTAYWINYWSEGIVEAVGDERIRHSGVFFDGGILRLQECAIDTDLEEDMMRHTIIHELLFG